MMAILLRMPVPNAPAFHFTSRATLGLAGFHKALWFSALLMCALASPSALLAQQNGGQEQPQIGRQPTLQLPQAIRPTPRQLELSKMLWSTIVAVDHANQSGNYSVLRDISAQGFQIKFNPAQLTELFSGLRRLNVDLSNALLVPPTYYEAPTMVSADTFRVKGIFQLRPISIEFEVYYQWEQGRWKLFGVELKPREMSASQPAGN